MEEELKNNINEIEQALLLTGDIKNICLLSQKVFSELDKKDMSFWLEKEMGGLTVDDFKNPDFEYRIFDDLPMGVILHGEMGFHQYTTSFFEIFKTKDFFFQQSIGSICSDIKRHNEDSSRDNEEFFIEGKKLDNEYHRALKLENFRPYNGPLHIWTKVGYRNLQLVEDRFREKLYKYIVDIQKEYGIKNSPKLKIKGALVEINNDVSNNVAVGNKGKTLQSGGNVESANQGVVIGDMNNKSKVEQKPGWISKIIGWFKL